MIEDNYVTQFVDGKYYLMVPLASDSFNDAVKEAGQVVDDLLACISIVNKCSTSSGSYYFAQNIEKLSEGLQDLIV